MKIRTMTVALALAATSSLTQASLVGVNTGFSSGGASFIIDNFNATHTAQPFGPFAGDYDMVGGEFTSMNAASGSSGGGLLVTSSSNNDMAILTSGTPNDGRLYSSAIGSFDFSAYTFSAGPANSLKLVVKNKGGGQGGPSTDDGNGSATLDGVASTGRYVVTEGANSITTYFWDNLFLSSLSLVNIDYDSAAPHKSFDAFAIVTNPSSVPVPAAAWLFGSAVLSLGLVRKK